jgi:hypothetical protein
MLRASQRWHSHVVVSNRLVQRRTGIKDMPVQNSLCKASTTTAALVARAKQTMMLQSTLLKTLGFVLMASIMSASLGWLEPLQ